MRIGIRIILVGLGLLTVEVFVIIGIIEGIFFNTSLSLISWIIILIINLGVAYMLELPQYIFYCIKHRLK